MYEDIIELAQNQMFLEAVGGNHKPNVALLKHLPPYEDLVEFEEKLQPNLTFESVFHEPHGFYLIKTFLKTEHSSDKAVFISDVELYQKLQDQSGRHRVARKIFQRFCLPEKPGHIPGVSVFEKEEKVKEGGGGVGSGGVPSSAARSVPSQPRYSNVPSRSEPHTATYEDERPPKEQQPRSHNDVDVKFSFLSSDTNVIGVYGKAVKDLQEKIEDSRGPLEETLFNGVAEHVLNDLRLDVFPRFCRSPYYRLYIRLKSLEEKEVNIRSFRVLRVLGRGAFGSVNASVKLDTGKVYAMKRINKKRVQGTDSVKTIMAERNFLAEMISPFVTGLKYAVQDSDHLYLIMDLMVGGDLKFHLNKNNTFGEDRGRFYAAEVLLGLEHIHSKGIVYRDLKLENVLMDEHGHCRISDLGLAVRRKNGKLVRGYAGTPGYTAPEVVLNQYYDHRADYFSLGVMIYRFICGNKPFQSRHRSSRHHKTKDKQKNGKDHKATEQRRKSNELDHNVIQLEPEYDSQYFSVSAKSLLKGLLAKDPDKRLGSRGIVEIKNHPWFDDIDFGLLEAGYLPAPFVPRSDEVNANAPMDIGRPPRDGQYDRTTLTPEFENSLREFPFTSQEAMQDEIVEVLKQVDLTNLSHSDTFADIDGGTAVNAGCLDHCSIL